MHTATYGGMRYVWRGHRFPELVLPVPRAKGNSVAAEAVQMQRSGSCQIRESGDGATTERTSREEALTNKASFLLFFFSFLSCSTLHGIRRY